MGQNGYEIGACYGACLNLRTSIIGTYFVQLKLEVEEQGNIYAAKTYNVRR